MRISVTIEGDLNAMMAAEVSAGQRAVTGTMRAAGIRLKEDWRGQIGAAGLGRRLANAVRSQTYPQARPSLNAASLIWSKAPVITAAHEAGALIRSASGFWLAIPLPAAGKGRSGARATPAEWERRTGRRLRFVYRRGRTALLVDDGTVRAGHAPAFGERAKRGFRNRTVPVFALVPQVKLPKRLNLMAAADQVGASLPAAIVANWRVTR